MNTEFVYSFSYLYLINFKFETSVNRVIIIQKPAAVQCHFSESKILPD